MNPLVLLTNDDGIESHYLVDLAAALQESGIEVMVAAPEKPRSAMSHSITLHKPLRVSERGAGRYAVSGSPVDCVYIALHSLCSRPPDIVVSGINDGYNLGTDVFYSGTVGAAVEGGLRGVTGLAISTEPGRKDMSLVVGIAAKVVAAGLAAEMPAGSVVNVNIPRGCDGRYRWTRLGKRFYGDDVHEREDPRGRSYYWIGGGHVGMGDEPGTDCHAIGQGLTSLTPLTLDRTDRKALDSGDATWSVEGLAREDA
jgi:5'-nucleotidase